MIIFIAIMRFILLLVGSASMAVGIADTKNKDPDIAIPTIFLGLVFFGVLIFTYVGL